MSEKLRELLDDLKEWINTSTDEIEYYGIWELEAEDIKALLHYINQLQQENQQLKEQLQQRDSIIEECTESIQNFMTHIDDGFCADMMTFIDILNKYKGDNNE